MRSVISRLARQQSLVGRQVQPENFRTIFRPSVAVVRDLLMTFCFVVCPWPGFRA
jgi:hypothetical protein